jgi:asparagine synthase (glutamine-hydrolysing)
MCGICGIFSFEKGASIQPGVIRQMTQVLTHRGPDDEGIYINKNIGLGHRRLSIIDLTTGHQPISNQDGTLWIVYNGEVYNYLELMDKLKSLGHIFKTRSDTETIIHAYEEWGDDFVNRLRGMFAFAIWDEKNNKLLLARDRLGIKPLHYMIDRNRIVFGSEIKSILQDPMVKKEVDFEALEDYFTYLYVRAPRTMFKGIKKLLPGHVLICTPEAIRLKEYWDLNFSNVTDASEGYYTDKLIALLEESVRIRLMSEVPLGAFLSGGIDSSSVVAIMSGLLDSPVITSSIGFEDEKFNEIHYAKKVADRFNTDHHEFIVKPDALKLLPKLVWHFDEPFADSSAIPTYYVSETARRHVTVALSGDGGDENFAGYRNYFIDRLENYFRIMPDWFRKALFGNMAKIYPKADYLPQFLRGKTFLQNVSVPPARAYHNTKSTFKSEIKNRLYSKELKNEINKYDPFTVFEDYYNKANTDDHLSRILYVDMKTYLVDDILTKVDRMSMANSLEVRVPILDHIFMEFVATIPSDLKLKGKTGKYIFKKALRDLVPEEILERKKWGFGVPIGSWFRNEIKEFTEEILFSSKSRQRGYFDVDYIQKMWKEHQRGIKNYTHHLWILLMFEMWHQTFIDSNSISEP